jgi:hypothetical protein
MAEISVYEWDDRTPQQRKTGMELPRRRCPRASEPVAAGTALADLLLGWMHADAVEIVHDHGALLGLPLLVVECPYYVERLKRGSARS